MLYLQAERGQGSVVSIAWRRSRLLLTFGQLQELGRFGKFIYHHSTFGRLEYRYQEQHFQQAHFPCTYASCQAQKFVVFGSALDLKAHMVEVHGSDMSAKDMKDARRIQAEFEFEEVSAGGRRGRRDRGDREREREPPPHAGPSRANAAGARRREAFGGNLTSEAAPATNGGANRVPSRRQSPSPDMDPVVAE